MRETNCPNCGAPIVGSRCEYCGTMHFRHGCAEDKTSELLKLTTDYHKHLKDTQVLYEEALRAMRSYGNGIITANEARELIGLKRRY